MLSRICALSTVALVAAHSNLHTSTTTISCTLESGVTAQLKRTVDQVNIECPGSRDITVRQSGIDKDITCDNLSQWCTWGMPSDLLGLEVVDPTTEDITAKVDIDLPPHVSNQRNSVDLECSDPQMGRKMILHFSGDGLLKVPDSPDLQNMCREFLSTMSAPHSNIATESEDWEPAIPPVTAQEPLKTVAPDNPPRNIPRIAPGQPMKPRPVEPKSTRQHPARPRKQRRSSRSCSVRGCRNQRVRILVRVSGNRTVRITRT